MQILKCLKGSKKAGQNVVEAVFIIPILVIFTLAIFELALYWQDVNAVYALNNEISANAALIDLSNLSPGTTVCPAVDVAQNILEKKDSSITLNNPTYTHSVEVIEGQAQGFEPFALYKITSNTQVDGKPQITAWVDCRNPFEKGIITQIEFFHKTVIMKASIPRLDKPEPIVIIPDKTFIASPKLVTSRHY